MKNVKLKVKILRTVDGVDYGGEILTYRETRVDWNKDNLKVFALEQQQAAYEGNKYFNFKGHKFETYASKFLVSHLERNL